MRITKKKIAVVVSATAIVALSGGAAMAYWTAGGTGTGNGNASTQTPAPVALTVVQTSAPTTMAPGVSAGAISATVTNPLATGRSVYATQVVVAITGVTKAGGAPAGTCDATDYSLTGATMTTGAADLAAGSSTVFSGASLGFVNKASNQDACKGATVALSYTAS